MATSEPDSAGVIAPPPLIYLGFLGAGVGLDFALPYPLLPEAVQYWLGGAVIAASFAILPFAFPRFRAKGTSIDVRKPTTAIVTDGAYGWSRNPLYLALALLCAGIGIMLDGLWVAAMLAPTLAVVHYGVIRREERYLEAKFGQEYLDYKSKVRRWI